MAENEPIEITKEITWQQQAEGKLAKAKADKDGEAVVYYNEVLLQPFPSASFDLFKQSFAYPYWIEDNRILVDNTTKAL